ncbi:hypothetical protein MASR2M70_00760 [Bacillota bacterium]
MVIRLWPKDKINPILDLRHNRVYFLWLYKPYSHVLLPAGFIFMVITFEIELELPKNKP